MSSFFIRWIAFAVVLAGALARAQDNPQPTKDGSSGGKQESPASASPESALKDLTDPAGALLKKLSPEHLKAVGEMLDKDWPDKPEWAQMAVAVFRGDAMGMKSGWWRESQKRYDWKWLTGKFDKNLDRQIDPDELAAALPQKEFFERLDRDFNGLLAADDFDWYSRSLIPNPQRLMADNLFFMLDADSNGRVTQDEIDEFFRISDQGKLGFVTGEDFSKIIGKHMRESSSGGGGPDASDMVRMFLAGELGCFEPGPELDAEAPDFSLPTHEGDRTVTLSESRGKRPVVLIFGSFT